MTRIAPYAEQREHMNVKGPGDARRTATQIIEHQGLVAHPSWADRVVLTTGCSAGELGPETAKAMRLIGADVYITSRERSKGQKITNELLADGKPGKVEVISIDLGSFKSHSLLFNLLKDALLASASPSFNSRIFVVVAAAHHRAEISFDSLDFDKTEYTPLGAHDQSLADILFANELDPRYQCQNLRASSLDPSGTASTVWAAVGKEWEVRGGLYLDECADGWLTPDDALYYHGGYAPQAFDLRTQKKL
ncbi:short chain dehydrogenase [Xylaria bambusicola]|uniref:short chain dehydrogenase n=1 Tax=Xylaria bambusicola TaxID=326684 RepID=UPI002007E6F2|nr:short chain dehydrogenase [Xylaria bambusicola]KAI0513290.1 short chain dehydrogenase [Xylaria bambusicola]